jgi:hypothetical protein
MSQEPMTERIMNLFSTTQLTFEQIAQEVGCTYKVVWKRIHDNFTKEQIKKRKSLNYSRSKMGAKNPMLGKVREQHHGWKGECSDCKGYLTICPPQWYKTTARRVFVHHVVMAEALELPCIPRGFVVHHVDGNKTNNHIDNLALMTQSDHTKLHHWLRCRD